MKETQTKSADVGRGRVKVTGEPVARSHKPTVIYFICVPSEDNIL